MKCYFPIPSLSTNNSRVICAPQPPKNREADTINQLRLENELLKKQLSALINNKNQQAIQNQPIPFQSNHMQKIVLNNEQQVQQRYKSKMLKLKSGRSSSRNSNHYETTPSSPKKLEQYKQVTNFPQRIPFVPLPLRNQQNLKVMIVQRDNNGRFFRDRQSEEKVKTVRRNSPPIYPHSKDVYSPKSIQVGNFPPQQFLTNIQKNKGHQRSETAPIQQQGEFCGQMTKRVNSRYSTAGTNQNICDFSRQLLDNRKQNVETCNQKMFKKLPSNHQMKLDLNAKSVESRQIIKPNVVSPRGAAYIDRIEALNSKNTKKQTEQDEDKNESLMSIEKNIVETKRKRKLRYDIYMDEDRGN